MRIVLFIFSLLTFLCSCSRYQYLKISSDTIRQNHTNEFVAENDSFRVVYKFDGLKGPVQIAIVNKTAIPLQVDWNKSFFIKKGKSRSLFTPHKRKPKKGKENQATYSTNEIITPQQSLEPVPLRGSINKVSLELFPKGFLKVGGHKSENENIDFAGSSKKVKRSVFSKEDSPLSFRLHLAISVEGKSEAPIILDNFFYISELVTTKTAPEKLPEHSDKIVVQKPKIARAVLRTAGAIVGTAVVLLIKLWLSQWESDD